VNLVDKYNWVENVKQNLAKGLISDLTPNASVRV
jgi:hypothetical protein